MLANSSSNVSIVKYDLCTFRKEAANGVEAHTLRIGDVEGLRTCVAYSSTYLSTRYVLRPVRGHPWAAVLILLQR